MRTILLAVAVSVATAAPSLAQSQPLKLDFQNGLVTVEATAVPVRTILIEWGRVGGTKIVGAERISGVPLTVKLVNVSEAKALETILRSVAGYMAAPRHIVGAGPSMYDRILVMATSSAPASTSRPPAQGNNNSANGQRLIQPRPPSRPERPEPAEEPEQVEPDENEPNPPVFTFPQPGQQNGSNQPGQFNGTPGNQPGQNVINGNPAGNAPQGITINPATPGRSNVPGAPIGVSTPGMMVQPPQPQQPVQPGMIKPPGGIK